MRVMISPCWAGEDPVSEDSDDTMTALVMRAILQCGPELGLSEVQTRRRELTTGRQNRHIGRSKGGSQHHAILSNVRSYFNLLLLIFRRSIRQLHVVRSATKTNSLPGRSGTAARSIPP